MTRKARMAGIDVSGALRRGLGVRILANVREIQRGEFGHSFFNLVAIGT